jgi:hypothetical protein
MMEVIGAFSQFKPRPFVQIVDDVIFAVPDIDPLRVCLIRYARSRSDSFWQKVTRRIGSVRGRAC